MFFFFIRELKKFLKIMSDIVIDFKTLGSLLIWSQFFFILIS